MKALILALVTIVGLSLGNYTLAESDHDHSGHDHSKEEKKKKKSRKHVDHQDHEDHGHDEEEGHDHSKEKGHKKEDGHSHKKKEKHDDHKGHDHNSKHKHGEGEKHDDHGGPKFGKGKAIVEIKKEGKLFKLAAGAIKTLSLKTVKLDSASKGIYEIPASAIVDFQDEIGVYRRNGDWFELIEVKVVQRGRYSANIKSSNLAKNYQIVSHGVPLLRVAHLEASGQGGQGHVH